MKKFTLISLIMVVMLGFNAFGSKIPEAANESSTKSGLVDMEKDGFLTTKKCAEAGSFQDCYLQNYICGSDDCFKEYAPGVYGNAEVVLYSHKDGIIYNLDTSEISMSELDKGINRNEVTIGGKYDASTQTIYATEFKAPPPPKKSFFKGCL